MGRAADQAGRGPSMMIAAAACHEQSSGIEQVNKAVMQMDETTQQNAAPVEQATAASEAIVDQAQALNAVIARYRVGQGASVVAAAPARAPAVAERRGQARPWSGSATGKPRAMAIQSAAPKPESGRKVANAVDASEWETF